jgi:hypothetical protein
MLDMGLLDILRIGRPNAPSQILSPTASTSSLSPAVIADWLGDDLLSNLPLTRAEAMSIPVVARGRNLICSTIAKFPLRALNREGLLPFENQPRWLYSTAADNPQSPYERMFWTIDDILFYGAALWYITRGAADRGGRRAILSAEHVPAHLWDYHTDPDGVGYITLNGARLDAEQYLLFNPPHEGLLNTANRTLRGARDTEKAWTGRARNPIPLIELHRVDEGQLEESEIKAHVAAWATARQAENGAIGYTPQELEIRVHGEVKADLFMEGRNAVRGDVASHLNIRASMLDGTTGTDSLTYTTKDGERNLFYELDLPYWTDPLEGRLSLDDVLPSGQRIRFDKYDAFNLPTPTGPVVED